MEFLLILFGISLAVGLFMLLANVLKNLANSDKLADALFRGDYSDEE